MSSDKTKTERQKIESARQQKIRDKEEQKNSLGWWHFTCNINNITFDIYLIFFCI